MSRILITQAVRADPQAGKAVRRALRAGLQGAVTASMQDDVLLAITEVVEMLVQAQAPPVDLVRVRASLLPTVPRRVELSAQCAPLDLEETLASEPVRVRLLERLCSSWGVERRPMPTVWAVVDETG